MSTKRGRYKYLPLKLLEEFESVRQEERNASQKYCFEKIADHCKVGREVNRMAERFVMADLFKKKRKKR